MSDTTWGIWSKQNTIAYCLNHSKYLWEMWSHCFHSGWEKEALIDHINFEKTVIYIYILLQKYLELYRYHNINKIDSSFEDIINNYISELIKLYTNIGFEEYERFDYNHLSTKILYSKAKKVDLLKHDIETDK